jgi:hypothetical protein
MLESGSVFGSTRRWLVLARWRVVALAAALGWAGVCVADAERRQTATTVGVAGEGCSNTAPIQIMMPGYSGDKFKISVAEISRSLPHFRAFVTTVTEHINSRLAENKLCVDGAESMESMGDAIREQHSLLQFVHWNVVMARQYLVSVMNPVGGLPSPSCRISSPWIDLVVYREPIPHVTPVSQIRGIVRWNERQMLADQAALDGAKNVPPGVAMPLTGYEFGYFSTIYENTIYPRLHAAQTARFAAEFGLPLPPQVAEELAKPNEEHDNNIPPDLLWLFLRSSEGLASFRGNLEGYDVTKKSAAGYTKLVLALIDRCLASDERTRFHYTNILDVADPVLLEQYKIDTSKDWLEQYKRNRRID